VCVCVIHDDGYEDRQIKKKIDNNNLKKTSRTPREKLFDTRWCNGMPGVTDCRQQRTRVRRFFEGLTACRVRRRNS